MSETPVLRVERLYKHFDVPGLRRRERGHVRAVDGVSFELRKGEILALVGESGSGKTTLALTVMGLERATGGRVWFEGEDTTGLARADQKRIRRRIQMVFQDPYESLNPRMTVSEIVAEPLVVHRVGDERGRAARVVAALEEAGLKPAQEYLHRRPTELSGGQRQRVGIAAALVLEPPVLVADEPVSMLDVSIRAEILNLLAELRQKRGISVLLVTHDLSTAARYADRVAVMYLGRIVELGPTAGVLHAPRHPYTRALLSVIPVPNPRLRRQRLILQGETPDPVEIPSGCRFHPRCPEVVDLCPRVDPEWRELAPGHGVACHVAE